MFSVLIISMGPSRTAASTHAAYVECFTTTVAAEILNKQGIERGFVVMGFSFSHIVPSGFVSGPHSSGCTIIENRRGSRDVVVWLRGCGNLRRKL